MKRHYKPHAHRVCSYVLPLRSYQLQIYPKPKLHCFACAEAALLLNVQDVQTTASGLLEYTGLPNDPMTKVSACCVKMLAICGQNVSSSLEERFIFLLQRSLRLQNMRIIRANVSNISAEFRTSSNMPLSLQPPVMPLTGKAP